MAVSTETRIFYEAYRRVLAPEEIQGGLTLIVGTVGLIVNVVAALILRRSARENLNAEGAFLHVGGEHVTLQLEDDASTCSGTPPRAALKARPVGGPRVRGLPADSAWVTC